MNYVALMLNGYVALTHKLTHSVSLCQGSVDLTLAMDCWFRIMTLEWMYIR